MDQSTVTTTERQLRLVPNLGPAGCVVPWCILNHADPLMEGMTCHISNVDWSSRLGLGLGVSDDQQVAVEVLWDHLLPQQGDEYLRWTPQTAREVAAHLIELADAAEDANGGAR